MMSVLRRICALCFGCLCVLSCVACCSAIVAQENWPMIVTFLLLLDVRLSVCLAACVYVCLCVSVSLSLCVCVPACCGLRVRDARCFAPHPS